MSAEAQGILRQALSLSAADRARLVDALLSSLDRADETIDALWRGEVEDRIEVFRAGRTRAVLHDEVLSRYRQGDRL